MWHHVGWVYRLCRKSVKSPKYLVLGGFSVLFGGYWFFRPQLQSDETGDQLVRRVEAVGKFQIVENVNKNVDIKPFWYSLDRNVGVYAVQGRRISMEDRFNFIVNLKPMNVSIYGVFDGHGGQVAADFARKMLFKSLSEKIVDAALAGAKLNYSTLLHNEILAIDHKLMSIVQQSEDPSGSTAIVAVLDGDMLTVANVGDSRGVLCDGNNNAVTLSEDHKPNLPREKERIEAAGGFIVHYGVWRVAGMLAMSRALGDYPLKIKRFVIADPDVAVFNVRLLGARFFILASDGLWDVVNNEEAIAFISKRLHEPDYGAKSLVTEAYNRGSMDNITVMVVVLNR